MLFEPLTTYYLPFTTYLDISGGAGALLGDLPRRRDHRDSGGRLRHMPLLLRAVQLL